jgi:hypothetical protein
MMRQHALHIATGLCHIQFLNWFATPDDRADQAFTQAHGGPVHIVRAGPKTRFQFEEFTAVIQQEK